MKLTTPPGGSALIWVYKVLKLALADSRFDQSLFCSSCRPASILKILSRPPYQKGLPSRLHLVAVIEVYIHAPLLQCQISLRRPANARLPVTAGRPAEYASEIVKTRTLAAIELLLHRIPNQAPTRIQPGLVAGCGCSSGSRFRGEPAPQSRLCAGAVQAHAPSHPPP